MEKMTLFCYIEDQHGDLLHSRELDYEETVKPYFDLSQYLGLDYDIIESGSSHYDYRVVYSYNPHGHVCIFNSFHYEVEYND